MKALALDKRKEVASLPLDFKAERDEQNRVTGLSNGQRVMLRAGLKKLQILEEQLRRRRPHKHPKLLIVCEDTKRHASRRRVPQDAPGLVKTTSCAVDSGRKGEMSTEGVGADPRAPVRHRPSRSAEGHRERADASRGLRRQQHLRHRAPTFEPGVDPS